MHVNAFVSSFTGVSVRCNAAKNNVLAPRCKMGDSMAPVIHIKDTKSDATSSVKVNFDIVPPQTSEAISVMADAALKVTLKSHGMATLPPKTEPIPHGVSATDFYYPPLHRYEAPFIELRADQSISVQYCKVEKTVAGVSSNAPDSPAFWKAPGNYKWVSDSDSEPTSTPVPEVLSSADYEAYYPAKYRYLAPLIKMKKPLGPWDTTAYLEVGCERVPFNPIISGMLVLPDVDSDEIDADPPATASAAIATYYPSNKIYRAPDISISATELSITVGSTEVPVNPDAVVFLAEMKEKYA